MKEALISSLSKLQLRMIVDKITTINSNKINKMNKEKLLIHVRPLSYNKIKELLK